MANLASAKQYLNDTEVQSDAPLSEALLSKAGASINYSLDLETRIAALETAKTGAVYYSAGTYSSTTILSFTVSTDADDIVSLTLGGRDTTGLGAFSTTTSFSVSAGTWSIAWKRGGSNVRATNGSSATNFAGTWFDTPGAGTFTYTLVVTGAWDGSAVMRKIAI
jgi:hypothetical protein